MQPQWLPVDPAEPREAPKPPYNPLDDVTWSVRRSLLARQTEQPDPRVQARDSKGAERVGSQADSPGFSLPLVPDQASQQKEVRSARPCSQAKARGERNAGTEQREERGSIRADSGGYGSGWDRKATGGGGAAAEAVRGNATQRKQPTRRRPPHRRLGRETRGRSRNRKAETRAQSTQRGDRKREVQVMTWNVGGLPKDRMTEMVELLPALGLGHVEVLAMQEVSCPPRIMEVQAGKGKGRWRIVAGKKTTEWRGRMIAVRESLGRVIHKELEDDALKITIKTADGKLGVLNVHLPPKATLSDTGRRTTAWSNMRSVRQPSKMVMGDLNETLVRARASREEWSTLQQKTARGAMLLQWLSEQDMQAPNQEMMTPTYHPYNHLHQPRRLDYIFFAEIEPGTPGKVHQLRHLASSDHDAVTASMTLRMEGRRRPRDRPVAQHGARQLRAGEVVQQTLEQSKTWKGDRLKHLQRVARQITETRTNPFRYVESRDIKELRAEAMRRKHTPAARTLWKQVWQRKKQHRDRAPTRGPPQ